MFSHQQHQDYLREQRLARFAQSQLPPQPSFTQQEPPTHLSQLNPRLANHIPEQINDDEIDSMADSHTTCGSASSLSFQTDAEEKDQQILQLQLLDEPQEHDDDQWLEGKLKLEDLENAQDDSYEKVRPGFHRDARLINLGERRKPPSSRYEEEEKQPYRAQFKPRLSSQPESLFSRFSSKTNRHPPPAYHSQKLHKPFRRL